MQRFSALKQDGSSQRWPNDNQTKIWVRVPTTDRSSKFHREKKVVVIPQTWHINAQTSHLRIINAERFIHLLACSLAHLLACLLTFLFLAFLVLFLAIHWSSNLLLRSFEHSSHIWTQFRCVHKQEFQEGRLWISSIFNFKIFIIFNIYVYSYYIPIIFNIYIFNSNISIMFNIYIFSFNVSIIFNIQF